MRLWRGVSRSGHCIMTLEICAKPSALVPIDLISLATTLPLKVSTGLSFGEACCRAGVASQRALVMRQSTMLEPVGLS